MFENPSSKLIVCGKVVFWVGTVCSVLTGIPSLVASFIPTAITIAVCILASYLSSLLICAIGGFFENIESIANKNKSSSAYSYPFPRSTTKPGENGETK